MNLSEKIEKSPIGALHKAFKLENKLVAENPGILAMEDACQTIMQPLTNLVTLQKVSYDFSGKTVLAVDDVSFNLCLIDIFFKNTGAQMLFAINGKEAVDTIISNPQVDIVLMDVQMPVMNGLDATREIKKIKPGLPVIAITAFVHTEDRQRCFDAGCVDFLPKPCRREDLLMTVNNFFQPFLPL